MTHANEAAARLNAHTRDHTDCDDCEVYGRLNTAVERTYQAVPWSYRYGRALVLAVVTAVVAIVLYDASATGAGPIYTTIGVVLMTCVGTLAITSVYHPGR